MRHLVAFAVGVVVAWLLGRRPARRPSCTRMFVSGHPQLSICPSCGRAGVEHQSAPASYAGPSEPGVDWLTPMLKRERN